MSLGLPKRRASISSQGASAQTVLVALPPVERFTPATADAVSLFVRDTCANSKFHSTITVYGHDTPRTRLFRSVNFHGVKQARAWFCHPSTAYSNSVARQHAGPPPRLLEIHNDVGVFNCLTKRFPSAATIFYLHQDPGLIPQLDTPKDRWQFLNQASVIVCSSDFIRRRFLTGLEAARTDHVRVIYHGATVQPAVPQKDPYILFVGRMRAEKGVAELVEATRLLLPHYPNWRLVMVGSQVTKPGAVQKAYQDNVHQQLKKLGKQAVWLNTQPHDKLQQLYARAAIAVVPSITPEPVGRTAIEALASGSALVSSGLGALYEILGNSGVVVDPVTPQGLALALQGLIEDPATLHGVQRECLQRGTDFSVMHSQQQIDRLRQYLMSDSYVSL
jgi:UDP-glucose:(glucosyl)LPS alpha-1,2-glucosyltransferase